MTPILASVAVALQGKQERRYLRRCTFLRQAMFPLPLLCEFLFTWLLIFSFSFPSILVLA